MHQLPLCHLCSFKTKSCVWAHCAFGELQLIAKLNYVLANSFFLTLINNSVLVNNVEYFTQCALPFLQFPDIIARNSPMCFQCGRRSTTYCVCVRFLNLFLVNLFENYQKYKSLTHCTVDWSLRMGHLCNFRIKLHVTAQCAFGAGGAQLLLRFRISSQSAFSWSVYVSAA